MKLVIRNIGLILSGMIEKPFLDGDCIVAENGVISAIGYGKDLDTGNPDTLIDAKGTVLSPGLIDSHVHPVIGDYTPRQQQINWINSCLHGGVTTMISAGEVHAPGRPKDIVGLKAMAIAAQRWYENFRPSGVKMLAGAPVIEDGMEEQDFKDLSEAGVTLLGEVGLGSVKAGDKAKQMVAWARKYGIQSTIHTGGPSIPGSGLIDKDVVLEADADIIGHINGGHTALPDDQIICLCENCKRGIEIVHNGNERAGLLAMRTAFELKEPARVILGTDAPGGLRGAAAWHSADDRHAVEPWRCSRRNCLLFCDRQHGADARVEQRYHRSGPCRRLRADRPRPACTGKRHAGLDQAG